MKQVVMSVVLPLFVATSALADTSKEFVQSKTDTVLNIVQKSKDVATAKKEITKESESIFDFQKLTAFAVGKNWRSATPEQKTKLTTEFKSLLINTYGNAMIKFKNAKVNVNTANDNGDSSVVKTTVIYGENQKASIDYQLNKSENSWRVFDVSVENISLVMNYRTSFNEIVSKNGIDGLIAELHKKNEANK
jgi:phospholipid transport system substrate-binding protein